MKNPYLLLVLSALALTGCDLISVSNGKQTEGDSTQNQTPENTILTENNAGNTGENTNNSSSSSTTTTTTDSGTNTGTNTNTNTGTNSGTNTNTGTGSNTGTNTDTGSSGSSGTSSGNKLDIKDLIPKNTPYSLQEKTEFTWHDGREPDYAQDWEFYLGTSNNPGGSLWTNPNESSNYSGVELEKNSLIVSPAFESWLKVEMHFTLWFSSHISDKYKASDNQPQFYVEAYNSVGALLSRTEINIARSDVPKDNTAKDVKVYIREETMSFFILRFNNFIPNGNSGGYTAILCDASLKGWPYSS